ncbi:nucleolar protein 58 [Eutrema salsugineum]|uniref:nucleolar protein 58 n=1 Tax=Eutrema salsugineum TaxID=72664 RepID=UPI000CED160F|nr:nucleolar protein 58 [Eutrema salsugineum]
MKTVTGRVVSAEPISLSKAATILSRFVTSENGASQDVSAYLRRAAAAFTESKSFHKEISSSSLKETKTRSNARNERNQTVEFEEPGRAKGNDDSVENGGEIRFRKSEAVSEEESIKEGMKKKSKKNKEEDVVDEKVKENLEDEQRNEEKKERKKNKKSKKDKEEDVIDKKVNKKKRKSDGEMGSDEKKSKKKKKSKEIDG